MQYIPNSDSLRPGADNDLRVRLWPGQWYKRSFPSGSGVRGDGALPREDILQILENVESVLVK